MRNLLITTAAAALTVGSLIAAPTVDAHPGHPGVDNGTECFDEDWAPITCPPFPDPMRCQEDDPCWDPCTMGNHMGWTTADVWVDCRTVVI
jgi:hypothetical protein